MSVIMSEIVANVIRVDVVGTAPNNADMMTKGLELLKGRIAGLGGGQHAEFTIEVKHEGRTITVRKRFSEFSTLHDFLKERFPDRLSFDLPAKTTIRYFSQEALEDRKYALNAYMKELGKRQDMVSTAQVQTFFGITQSGAGYSGSDYQNDGRGGGANSGGYGGGGGGDAKAGGGGAAPAPKKAPRNPDDSDDDLVGWDR